MFRAYAASLPRVVKDRGRLPHQRRTQASRFNKSGLHFGEGQTLRVLSLRAIRL